MKRSRTQMLILVACICVTSVPDSGSAQVPELIQHTPEAVSGPEAQGAALLDSARSLRQHAQSLTHTTEHQSAIELFLAARRIYDSLGLHPESIACMADAASHMARAGEYERARDTLERVLEIGSQQLKHSAPRPVANAMYLLGFINFEQGNTQAALDYYERALDYGIAHLGGNDSSIAAYYSSLASLYRYFKVDHARAFELLQKAIEIRTNINNIKNPMIAYDYLKLGRYYFNIEDFEQALSHFDKSMAILESTLGLDHYYSAHIHLDRSACLLAQEEFNKAKKSCRQGIEVIINSQGDDSQFLTYMYMQMGDCYAETNELDKARTYYHKALNLCGKHFKDDHRNFPALMSRLARIELSAGHDSAAHSLAQRALKLSKAYHGKEHFTIADIYLTLGQVCITRGQVDSALVYFEQALPMFAKIHDGTTMAVADALRLGASAEANSEHQSPSAKSNAMQQLQKAMALYTAKLGSGSRAVALTHSCMATLLARHRATDQATRHLNAALKILHNSCSADSAGTCNHADCLVADELLLTILMQKANLAYSQYKQKGSDIDNLKLALASWQSAVTVFNLLYHEQSLPGQRRILLNQTAASLFEKSVQTAVEMYQYTQEERYVELAHAFADNSKSLKLLQAIRASAQPPSAAGRSFDLDTSAVRQTKSIELTLDLLDEELQAGPSNSDSLKHTRTEALYDQKFQLLAEFEEQLSRRHLNAAVQTVTPTLLQLSKTRSLLADSNSLAIEFFVGLNTLTVFTVSHNHARVNRQTFDAESRARIQALRAALQEPRLSGTTHRSAAEYAHVAFAVYQEFIAPSLKLWAGDAEINSFPSSLLIIPDRDLCYIPFEATVTSLPDSTDFDFRRLPYLLFQSQISYAWSSAVAQELNSPNYPNSPVLAAGAAFAPFCAVPTTKAGLAHRDLKTEDGASKRAAQMPLLSSAAEVQTFSHLIDGDVFLDSDASEAHFKKIAANFRLLHLATHGVINRDRPLHSFISFSEATDAHLPAVNTGELSATGQNDGFLFAYEIMGMQLNAEMISLSACNSGVGSYAEGEGVMSLARAFAYAGVPSIVMSLWPANDNTSAQIMQGFYQNLQSGNAKHAALRQAKIDYLEGADQILAHPAFWSMFVLSGDTTPLQQPYSTYTLRHLSFAALALLACGIVIWRFRSRKRRAA